MPSPRSEDALPAMSGHAACAVRDKIYIFGGRQNRKHLQRTYVLDTGDVPSARLLCHAPLTYSRRLLHSWICSYLMWQG